MLERFLKKSTWSDIIISLIFATLAIVLIVKPEIMVMTISTVLSVIFIIIGILTLIDYFRYERKDNYILLASIVYVIIGIVMLNYSEFIVSVFRIIIAIWIIYKGIINLQTTLVWKKYSSRAWLISVILAILTLGLGIYVLFSEGAILKTLGILLLIYAIIDIIDNLIFIKNIDDFKKRVIK